MSAASAQEFYFERITTADDLSNTGINALVQDHEGYLWIGTWDGLNKYDGYDFEVFRHHPLDATTITGNRIESLFVDHRGTLWIGTNEGLNRYDHTYNHFIRYQHNPDDPRSLTEGQVNVLMEDHASRLWVGTNQGGLFLYDPDEDSFTRFLDNPADTNNLLDTQVRALAEDRNGHIWIGTGDPFLAFSGRGLVRFNPETGTAKRFLHNPDDPNSLLHDKVSALFEDSRGVLWVSTCDNGLHQYDPAREHFIRLMPDRANPSALYAPQAVESVYGECRHGRIIHEDQTGALWFGTFNAGLHRYDPVAKTLTLYDHHPTDPGSLMNNQVWSFYEDRHGTIWIGNFGALHKLDPYANKFSTYRHDPSDPGSLSHDEIYAVYEAPNQIKENPHPPEVLLTGLRIFNGPVAPRVEGVTLSHTQNDLTFEYAGLHFANPVQNQYRYILEGYDLDWIDAGPQRSARYTNLGPGDYAFRVKASNSDGVWNEEGTSIRITIRPPWWRTWWAYGLYGLLLMAGIFLVDRVQRQRLIARERERARERELEQAREIETAYHELRDTKDRLVQQEKMASLGQLTAGIAHEIKNPLNFVNNFAELNTELADELFEEIDANPDLRAADLRDVLDDMRTNAAKIHEQGRRADSIVHAMMQHASGSTGQREQIDINTLVSEHIDLAYHGKRAQVSDLEVEIKRDLGADAGDVEMVPQEIGRVLLNLLGNASQVEIRVSDNGPGIPADIKDKIFEPFFTTKPTGSGTGLGLSLSYDIVTQGHGGMLTVESEEGQGATFIVRLPLT